MDFIKQLLEDFNIEFDSSAKKGISIALVLIILFTTGYMAGSSSSVNVSTNVEAGSQAVTETTAAATTTAPQTTAAVTAAVTEAATTPATTESAAEVPSTQPMATTEAETVAETGAETEAAAPSGTASTAIEDIVALFNEAVNKVKPEATKITRNFKNTRYDTERSVLPSALQSMANPMVEKYVKDDTEPVEYLTKEEIIENFPVPKQDYSSKLTTTDVTSATCTDNGTEYEITINLATSNNPTAGVGVGAACHFMDVSAIANSDAASSMLKKFDALYEGCVIKCKIDKASNRVTWANYYTPFSIDAIVNVVFSEVQTTVYMSYERDYTITY